MLKNNSKLNAILFTLVFILIGSILLWQRNLQRTVDYNENRLDKTQLEIGGYERTPNFVEYSHTNPTVSFKYDSNIALVEDKMSLDKGTPGFVSKWEGVKIVLYPNNPEKIAELVISIQKEPFSIGIGADFVKDQTFGQNTFMVVTSSENLNTYHYILRDNGNYTKISLPRQSESALAKAVDLSSLVSQ